MLTAFTDAISRAFDIRELRNLLAIAIQQLTRTEYKQVEWAAFQRADWQASAFRRAEEI